MIIREYKTEDFNDVSERMVSLQNFEKSLEQDRKYGEEMIDDYMKTLFHEVNDKAGKIFIADVDNKVVGFIVCWKYTNEINIEPYLYISDLEVNENYRNNGIGNKLI